MTKEEASKEISQKLAEINNLYDECAALASKYDVYFSYSGPAGYGDGGSFWDGEWQASSQSC